MLAFFSTVDILHSVGADDLEPGVHDFPYWAGLILCTPIVYLKLCELSNHNVLGMYYGDFVGLSVV